MEVDLRKVAGEVHSNEKVLFSQSQGRFVVTVSPEKEEEFESMLDGHYSKIGTVRDDSRFMVKGFNGRDIINEGVSKLKDAWKQRYADR